MWEPCGSVLLKWDPPPNRVENDLDKIFDFQGQKIDASGQAVYLNVYRYS